MNSKRRFRHAQPWGELQNYAGLPKPHMWCVDGMWACTHSRSPIFGTTYWRKSPQEAYVAWLDSVPWAARKSLLSQWRNELKGLS